MSGGPEIEAGLRTPAPDGLATARKAEEERLGRAALRPPIPEVQQALEQGAFERAEIMLRAHLKSEPDDPVALRLLALIAASFGATDQAVRILRPVLELAPSFAMARLQLAALLQGLDRRDEALALLDLGLAEAPDDIAALSLRGKLLVDTRRMDEAIAVFERLLALDPGNALRWLNYGFVLKTLGRLDEAVAAYRKSVSLDPASGAAWWGLANLKTVAFGPDDVAAMHAALAGAAEEGDDRIHLGFALGKALGDLGRYEDSFGHYAEANRLRKAALGYDPGIMSADARKAEAVFTRNYFARRAGQGSRAPDPIFIVSLPRSGSTLVEQILASHPLVEGTEELFEIQSIAGRLVGAKARGPHWQDNLEALSAHELHVLGETYLFRTRSHRSSDRPFFTDKMPGNWAYLGLILSILPNARIVDVRRNPLGCGFANFAQYFNTGVSFSYDLTDIGRAYRDYVRMMDHFDRVLPGRIHRIFYESLVEDFETEVRRLLDHLGLPFDPACLRFHETERAVHTPSAQQVRQPINRRGMDAWRPYAPWLGPLEAALGPVLDVYPQVPADWPD